AEESFHALVQVIFRALGFKVLSELAGAISRLDLSVQLTDETWVVIELKYCSAIERDQAVIDETLSALAMSKLSKSAMDRSLAEALIGKLGPKETYQILSKSRLGFDMSKAEENAVLAEASANHLTDQEFKRALAAAVEENLANDEIQLALEKNPLAEAPIDKILTTAANKALSDIKSRDYRSIIKPFASEIICMGLALYEHGARVKAVFEPTQADGQKQ
ncbi:MAG: hypothetical protein LBJ64_01850, partial [Deltaproteobacteria bacterium]|nr:hypothetical protein [Deltaproteobacteria bacterium]